MSAASAPGRIDRVLVPVDGSPLSLRALEHAIGAFPGAEYVALHVINYVETSYGAELVVGPETLRERARERAEEVFEEVRDVAAEYGVEVTTATETGKPAREIVAYADQHDVDLVVMGSHGREPVSRILLGSVAETVVRRASVPVTVVR